MKDGLGKLVMKVILGGAVIMLMSYLFEGVYVKDFTVAFLVAFILWLLNTFLKPILTIIAFPITLLTLGLFQLIINGFILSIATSLLAPDFQIQSFSLTILCSIFISIFYSILGLNKDEDD